MRAVVQRVTEASVSVDDRVVGAVGKGMLLLVSVGQDDADKDAQAMADKVAGLRCFTDSSGKFNLSVQDIEGGVLAISQFTLHGDCRKGRRPSFTNAAAPDLAIPLYEAVVRRLRNHHGLPVETGEFGAHMVVQLVNDGPVTLMIDTKKEF